VKVVKIVTNTRTPQNTSLQLPAFLEQTLLFNGLPKSQLVELAAIANVRFYDKEEILFQQGEPGNGFFIVQSGRIKVFKLSDSLGSPVKGTRYSVRSL
jgi:CRP-like cAMP-binding protein